MSLNSILTFVRAIISVEIIEENLYSGNYYYANRNLR
jgi:hypothetical protein